jgi:predicted LPLAT superfamily acyltransferase
MQEMAPQAGLNLMPVTDIGPETAILLKEKLERGEWIAIVGDRIAVNPQRGGEWRVCWSRFMGQPAPFPQGPFILASILRCPVDLIFALRQQGTLRIHCEPFADPLLLPRANARMPCRKLSIATPNASSTTRSSRRWTGLTFSISGSCRTPKRRSKGAERSPLYG